MINDFKYTIDGPVLIRNITDFTGQLRNEYEESDVVDIFEDIFSTKSGLTVYEVINIVWIMRSLIKFKDAFD